MLANSKSEGGPVNQREGQIITEYLAVLVESRIECETTHTSTDILTEKGLTPWTKATPVRPFLLFCQYSWNKTLYFNIEGSLLVHREKTKNAPNREPPHHSFFWVGRFLDWGDQ